jgi:hypothetical protein
VPGRAIFTTLAAAQAEDVASFTWDNFEIDESVVCYRITWSTVTSTSKGKCRLAATPQVINLSTVTNASSGAGTDHNTLSNLQGGSLTERYHLTAAEAALVPTALQSDDIGSTVAPAYPRAISVTSDEPLLDGEVSYSIPTLLFVSDQPELTWSGTNSFGLFSLFGESGDWSLNYQGSMLVYTSTAPVASPDLVSVLYPGEWHAIDNPHGWKPYTGGTELWSGTPIMLSADVTTFQSVTSAIGGRPALFSEVPIVGTASSKDEGYFARSFDDRRLASILIYDNNGTDVYSMFYESITESVFRNQTDILAADLSPLISSIGVTSFQNCTGLEKLNLQEGLLTISSNAFEGCTSLEEISLPSTMTSIGSGAFYGDSSLDLVTSLAVTAPTLGNGAFTGIAATQIHVPVNATGYGITWGGLTVIYDVGDWPAETVSQAEAEAGTATTRRAWTAQRVFQAVAAKINAGATWAGNHIFSGNVSVSGLTTVTGAKETVVAIGTVTSTHTLVISTGTLQTATLTASTACTFTMPTATAGTSFTLLLKQAATTGNGTATFTSVKWKDGTAPTITATAGKMDLLVFVSDGTNWYGVATQNFTP